MSRNQSKRDAAATMGMPSEDEMIAALEGAGYSLELRLFRQFADAEMDPVFAPRFRLDDDSYREVDLIARNDAMFTRPIGDVDRKIYRASLRLLIEAKKIHAGAFVGLIGDRPHEIALRALRCHMAGVPSSQVLHGDLERHVNVAQSGHIGEALDALSAPPFCVQWAEVKREEKGGNAGQVRANHEPGVADDLTHLVRVAVADGRSLSRFILGKTRDVVNVHFHIPTLILDAPVYTYTPVTKILAEVEALMLPMSIDGPDGVETRIVDVVSKEGVPALIARHKSAAEAARRYLSSDHSFMNLAVMGEMQRRDFTGER